jgi:two-component system CheB/CheR fusion protein
MDRKLHTALELAELPFLLLDHALRIETFTPPIKQLYSILPSDIGRSIEDLRSLADDDISADAREALAGDDAVDRDIVTRAGDRFTRRLSVIATHGGAGAQSSILIIYRRHAPPPPLRMLPTPAPANAPAASLILEASHDLRQPMQAFALLQGLLRRSIEGDRATMLLDRLDRVFAAMTSTLDSLVEINQIDTGTVSAEAAEFVLGDVMIDLAHEFADLAKRHNTQLRIVPSKLLVISNRRLLHQLLRNLVLHALRHAPDGRMLIGCRRHRGIVSVEIWDTGLRSMEDDVRALTLCDQPAPSGGTRQGGAGLSLVRRLANFLGHRVRARSRGRLLTMFAVDLPCASVARVQTEKLPLATRFDGLTRGAGTVFLVEADQHVRALMEMALSDEGYNVQAISELGQAAAKVTANSAEASLIVADYRTVQALSSVGAMNELAGELWQRMPAVILTGDIPWEEQVEIDRLGLIQLKMPVQFESLFEIIRRLMPRPMPVADRRGHQRETQPGEIHPREKQSRETQPRETHPREAFLRENQPHESYLHETQSIVSSPSTQPSDEPFEHEQSADVDLPLICVVDDDGDVRDAAGIVFEDAGFEVMRYADGETFLSSLRPNQKICLLVDAYLPGISGLDVLVRFRLQNPRAPAIMITGGSDVSMAVRAMKAGAFDFIEKPAYPENLLDSVRRAIAQPRNDNAVSPDRIAATEMMSRLTRREQEIMRKVLEGHPSKNIALDLGISKRTVENHRAAIMRKTGSNSLPALARLALNL